MTFRKTALAILVGLVGAHGAAFSQSDYPNKPITLIIPFPAGGVTDVVGREVARHITMALKQPVVIDNRAGAGGNVGTLALSRAKPDGYTLGILTVSAMSIGPHVTKNLGFNPSKDFTPVTNVVRTDGAIVAHSSTPFSTVQELVRFAKANPGKVSYASVGNGSVPHLTAEMFSQQAGISMLHVPYRGGAAAFQDVLAGHIQLSFETSLVSTVSNLSSGRLKILGTTGPKRAGAVPNVPTIAESGFPNFSAQAWFGLFGPANLPRQIVDSLNKITTAALRNAEVAAKFAKLGVTPDPHTPESFASFLQVEDKRWAAVAKTLKLQLD